MRLSHISWTIFFAIVCAAGMIGVGVVAGIHIATTATRVAPPQSVPVQASSTDAYTPEIEEDHGVPSSTLLEVLGDANALAPVATSTVTSATQYVLLSFDGSRSLQMWRDTIDFAREMRAQGKPLSFTYYASGVYFFPQSKKDVYHPPRHATGTSMIGYATDEEDVAKRITIMNEAIADGHEIGSHVNGHFNGSTWTESEWKSEFDQFKTFLTQSGALRLPGGLFYGYRAPELGRNPAMYKVLAEEGYLYDASGVRKPTDLPTRDANGIWELALGKIPYAHTSSSILSMDYNFYVKQSGARDVAKKGTPEWQKMYDDMLTSYRGYFDMNYNGPHAPVIIGHHFSTWNDGVYWEVMKTFEIGRAHV